MWEQLLIIHRTERVPFELKVPGQEHDWLFWKTCLRQIAFGSPLSLTSFELRPGDEVYHGEKAYEFVLEVTSGLKSRVIGETEILGQFKDLFLKQNFPATPWGQTMRKLMQSVLADVKTVRSQHLVSLGSHSYGSFARRYLKGIQTISFLGSGNLTQAMLPWLQKQSDDLRVFCRDTSRSQKVKEDFSYISLHSLSENMSVTGGLIVAAPMTAREIAQWIKNTKSDFQVIMDLRDTSHTDPISSAFARGTIIKLTDFFNELQANQKGVQEKVQQAYATIRDLTQLRTKAYVEIRPFGWEDLCG